MNLNQNTICTGVAGIWTLLSVAVFANTIHRIDKEETALEKIKTEIREKDPARYARTMEKVGTMTDTESKTFMWNQALNEMNDSLRNAASDASANYAKGVLIK